MALEPYVLTINLGSSSKKYSLRDARGRVVSSAFFERHAKGFELSAELFGETWYQRISEKKYQSALETYVSMLKTRDLLLANKVRATGIRVVAPGELFTDHHVLTDKIKTELKTLKNLAPLHLEPVLAELAHLPRFLTFKPVILVSDSAFHTTKSEVAKLYPIPQTDAKRFQLYRYGYHGLSNASVLRSLKSMYGKLPRRILIAHLGSGCSFTAVVNGKSKDTSMGFSPLEGVMMATRSGSLDPSVVLQLKSGKRIDHRAVETYLYHECGLKGVSGLSADLRVLLEAAVHQQHPGAKQAIELFLYSLAKEAGGLVAAMRGLDMMVFTGTIGIRSGPIRQRLGSYLTHLGVLIDPRANRQAIDGPARLHVARSRVKVVVIPPDEEFELYKATATKVRQLTESMRK